MDAGARAMMWLLEVYDRLMDMLTFGRWSRERGDERIAFYKDEE
jgi:hypothetical protein